MLVTDLVSVRKSMVMFEDHFQIFLTRVSRLVTRKPAFQKPCGNPLGKHGLLRWITAAFSVTTVTSGFPTRYSRNPGLSNP